MSPWNTPMFVIREKSGRWRLLQDLRAVNRVMQPVGGLQPGLPSPTAIPLIYCLCIIDLKDAFFCHSSPSKREKFTFTLPSPNHQCPGCQFHWTVLAQVMANSPTMCQEFVSVAIEPTCHKCPGVYILCYMADILISHPSESMLSLILADLTKDLEAWDCALPQKRYRQCLPFNI
jgi:hypothetical protein